MRNKQNIIATKILQIFGELSVNFRQTVGSYWFEQVPNDSQPALKSVYSCLCEPRKF